MATTPTPQKTAIRRLIRRDGQLQTVYYDATTGQEIPIGQLGQYTVLSANTGPQTYDESKGTFSPGNIMYPLTGAIGGSGEQPSGNGGGAPTPQQGSFGIGNSDPGTGLGDLPAGNFMGGIANMLGVGGDYTSTLPTGDNSELNNYKYGQGNKPIPVSVPGSELGGSGTSTGVINEPTGGPVGTLRGFNPKSQQIIVAAAQKYGVDPNLMLSIASIEDPTGSPTATNPKSQAAGLFQFMPLTAKQYGLTNPYDPVANAEAAAKLTRDNTAYLTKALGRTPTTGEIYLAHQQGAQGAAALLEHPNTPAVQIVGVRAVTMNGGSLNESAGAFASRWTVPANSVYKILTTQQAAPMTQQSLPDNSMAQRTADNSQVQAQNASTWTKAIGGILQSMKDQVGDNTPVSAPPSQPIGQYTGHPADAQLGGMTGVSTVNSGSNTRVDQAGNVQLPPNVTPNVPQISGDGQPSLQLLDNPDFAAKVAQDSANPYGQTQQALGDVRNDTQQQVGDRLNQAITAGQTAVIQDAAYKDAFISTINQAVGSPSYNTLFGGQQVTLANADHPNIKVPYADGSNYSTAAGYGQFNYATWNDLNSKYFNGQLDFSNEQDQHAATWKLAEVRYQQATGRDLLTDLKSGDTSQIQNTFANLGNTWSGLPGGKQPQTTMTDLMSNYNDYLKQFHTVSSNLVPTDLGTGLVNGGAFASPQIQPAKIGSAFVGNSAGFNTMGNTAGIAGSDIGAGVSGVNTTGFSSPIMSKSNTSSNNLKNVSATIAAGASSGGNKGGGGSSSTGIAQPSSPASSVGGAVGGSSSSSSSNSGGGGGGGSFGIGGFSSSPSVGNVGSGVSGGTGGMTGGSIGSPVGSSSNSHTGGIAGVSSSVGSAANNNQKTGSAWNNGWGSSAF